MDLQLAGKVALVAGSSRGIGKAIARAFLAEGCRTVLTGRGADELSHTRQEFDAEFGLDLVTSFAGDLTQASALHALRDQVQATWGGVDCLVANIGTGKSKPGWDLTEADWQSAFEMNLWGSVRLVTALLPSMTKAGAGGSIVLIASIAGVEATPAPLPYSAAKAALICYADNLARTVAGSKIRVNCVAPGNILFPGGSWEQHLANRKEQVLSYIEQEVPQQRFGTPEEIADLTVFLSSPRASFITGACMVADGGQTRSR